MRPGFRTAIVCALLFGGTLLLFSRATGFGFLNYDDPAYVTDNPVVQGGLSWAGVAWAFTAPADYWHPLTWLSHMLDCQLYGLSAAGHHFTSVLWHALNAVLAFLLFRRLTGRMWRSAFAAALFAWHPLRVESVVWVTERKDVMSGCFFMLTVLAYARFAAARSAGRPALLAYLLTLAFFAAGLMSKPMLVTLPLVLLLLDFWPLARQPAWPVRRLVFEKLPFFALAGAAAVATMLMQRNAGAFVLSLPLAVRLGNAVVSLALYLGKFLWPFDLIVCYSHPGPWPVGAILAAAALLIGLASAAWWQRRARPWLATGLAWFAVTLLPAIGLVQTGFQSMADRYTYLPMLGVGLALVQCIPASMTRPWRIAGVCAALAVLVACALRTWNQEGFWRDSETLFAHAVRVDSRNGVAEDFLGSAFLVSGRLVDARIHAERARALDPRGERALVLLAEISERQGQADEAMALYRAALAVRPDNPPVECQLGLLELGRGHPDRASELMIPALRSAPMLREKTRQLGRGALERDDSADALFLYGLVLTVAPDDAAAKAGASAALARAESDAADKPAILSRVAGLYARQGDLSAAIRVYRRVVALDPSDGQAHAALGYLLVSSGDRSGGILEWRRALELNPDIPGLREQIRKAGQ